MKKLIFPIAILFGMLMFSSCSDENEKDTDPEADYTAILANTGENVILKTYKALTDNADALEVATRTLESDQTQANLDAARAAWVNARAPWEQSEGFLFGPVDQEGLDPSLDSWPVNVTDLNNVLSSSSDLTVDFLKQQEGTLKGFHTIEFLLWGENGNKLVSEISDREFEYLAAAAGGLAADAAQLYSLWNPAEGNFIDNVLKAGNGSIVYISQKSALEEMSNAMVAIADEVANGKINDPLSQKNLTLEESRFSANSKADFANNIRSIKNIYTGKFETYGNGKSVSDIIKDKNSDLDAQVVDEINAAIDAITAIPGTFSDAVMNNETAVKAAQTAVRALQKSLDEQVLPLISNL